MNRIDIAAELVNATAAATSQVDRVRAMRDIVSAVGASSHVVVEFADQSGGASILASSWSHDAIALVGVEAIARLASWAGARGPSDAVLPFAVDDAAKALDAPTLSALRELGHVEFVHAGLHAGADSYAALFSARAAGCIDPAMVPRAALLCSYLLSARLAGRGVRSGDMLSERERECLSWVAEGKTTEETALILGVSGNTVNTYVANAIQKLSASNRVMAIATAIRQGII